MAAVLLAVVLATVAAGCGGKSDAEKARDQVCESASDIQGEIDDLKSISLESLDDEGKDEIRDALESIRDDLRTIQDQLPTLAEDVRSEVEAANDRFRASAGGVLDAAQESLSVSDARSGLADAFRELGDDYVAAFDQLDC